jgi:hypothetical protein
MKVYKTSSGMRPDSSFESVTQHLLDLVSARLRYGHVIGKRGTYSFRPANSQETIVKIIIFRRDSDMQGGPLWENDGVYVLVRTNGKFGNILWNDVLSTSSQFYGRMRRTDIVKTAPDYTSRFAHFPVMAGESLDAIADLIISLVESPAGACVHSADLSKGLRSHSLRWKIGSPSVLIGCSGTSGL